MTSFTLTNRLLKLKRVHLLGLGMMLIGVSMLLTPLNAPSSITNYVALILGIDRAIIGGLITVSGVLMPFLKPYQGFYLVCISPWGAYCIGALFFELENHLAATAGIAYSLIYFVMLAEVFDFK